MRDKVHYCSVINTVIKPSGCIKGEDIRYHLCVSLLDDVFQDTPDLRCHILPPAPVSHKPGYGFCYAGFHR